MKMGVQQWKWLVHAADRGSIRAVRPEHRQIVRRLVKRGLLAPVGEQTFAVTANGLTFLRQRIEEKALSRL